MSHPYPGWMYLTTCRSQGFLYLNQAGRCRDRGDKYNYRRYIMVAARWFAKDRAGQFHAIEAAV